MKTLKDYIIESSASLPFDINRISDIISKCRKDLKVPGWTTRIKDRVHNSSIIAKALQEDLGNDDIQIFSVDEYLDKFDYKWGQRNFVEVYGEIIIIDKDGKKYEFCVEVGDDKYGYVQLGYLIYFGSHDEDNSYYIFVNKSKSKVYIIDYEKVNKYIRSNKSHIVMHGAHGERLIRFEGFTFDKNDYVEGDEIVQNT